MFKSIPTTNSVFRVSCHAHRLFLAMSRRSASSSNPTHSTSSDDRLVPELPLDVTHDRRNREFFIQLSTGAANDDNRAYLQYSHISSQFIDLEHTVVPYKYRGQGIAKVLAKAAFDYCIEADKDMRLTCTYLQKYFNENPQPQYIQRVK